MNVIETSNLLSEKCFARYDRGLRRDWRVEGTLPRGFQLRPILNLFWCILLKYVCTINCELKYRWDDDFGV